MAINDSLTKMKLSFSDKNVPINTIFCLSMMPGKMAKTVEFCSKKDSEGFQFEICSESTPFTISTNNDIIMARSLCDHISYLNHLLLKFTNDVDINLKARTKLEDYLDQVNQLIQNVKTDSQINNGHLLQFFKYLEEYITHRTFCIGHEVTLLDIVLFSYVGKFIGFNKDLIENVSELGIHIKRWWRFMFFLNPIQPKLFKKIRACYPFILSATQRVTVVPKQSSLSCQQKSHVETKPYEGKLPNAVYGQVVTRFPPEPSGFLHIGHAKAALINDYYARLYGGKLILRFDDTNPAKESMEFEESILEDLKLLDITPDKITHTSDYFDYLQNLCETLIKKGHFYVDDTPVEKMREERMNGIESACRSNTVERNLNLWDQMKQGTIQGLQCCIRSKMDMKSPNKCLRDPVMFRCIVHIPHHIYGFQYKVYPMYDFACPIVDSLENVTHALRTNEYADRIPQYNWVLKQAESRLVHIYEFSRLNFIHTVLSKRKLQWFVDQKIVESWADPRFPTVRGIRRRGLLVEALREFVLEQGPSKNVNLMEWDKLWTKNKQKLDPIVPRYMAVGADGVRVHILNGPTETLTKPRQLHLKNESLGTALQSYSNSIFIERNDADSLEEGEEVTLMHWCNAFIDSIVFVDKTIESITMTLNSSGNFKTTKKKIHWIAATNTTRVVLRDYDYLISKKKLEEDDDILTYCNKQSVFDTAAFVDPQVLQLTLGSCVQFERRGYFRLDQCDPTQSPHAVFIKIPDGRSKSVSLVDTKIVS